MKVKGIWINPKNPRYIKDDRFLKLKNNIVEFPKMMKLRPIIIDDTGMILGGNMRYLALVELGYKDIPEGWVVKASELTEEERKQFTILDNVPFGDWDYDILANEWEMEKLQDWGIDKEQLEGAIINADDMEDEYDIEKPIEGIREPLCKLGQMWQLGEHRLLCGDSRKTEDIKKLMDGEQADMVFTDPPYNVNYSGQGKLGGIMNDNMSEEEFVSFTMDYMIAMKDNLKEGGVFYLCSGWSSYPIFVYAIKATGMVFANPIVWVKNNTSLGWNDYKYKYEMIVKGKKKKVIKKRTSPILYGWNGGKHYFKDTRFESDVWEIKRRASNTMVHPTISAGDVDSLSFLKCVLRQQNLKHCLFSTWCMAQDDILQIEEWLEAGKIKTMDAYVGEIFKGSYSAEYDLLKPIIKKYGGRFVIFRNHAKIIAGYGDKFCFAVESSANINTNPRCENNCLTIGEGIYEFYKGYFDGIISFEKDGR